MNRARGRRNPSHAETFGTPAGLRDRRRRFGKPARRADNPASGPSVAAAVVLRSVRYVGIKCTDIEKVLVQGGDRCVMGELERFGGLKGACLARLKLMPTEVVPFEK